MWTSRWERGLGLVAEPLRTPLSPYQQTSWTFGQLTADFVRSQDYLGYAWASELPAVATVVRPCIAQQRIIAVERVDSLGCEEKSHQPGE